MPNDAVIRARIDENIKNEATKVLANMGLKPSDAIRILMTKVAQEKALPFDLKMPNALTAETLKKADSGEDLHTAKDAKDLFNKLGI